MSDARFLVSAYGTYLSHHHGRLRVLAQPDDSCKFHFEYRHHHIAIRTHHHHFVGVNHHHEVYITDHHHESQLFHIERVPDGRIALKSHAHHTYIGTDPYGYVKAHHHIDAGQLFTERPVMYGGPVAAAGLVYNNPPLVAPVVAPIVAPPTVIVQPPGVYTTAPGVFSPAVQPVYTQPSVVFVEKPHFGHHHHHHGHHHHHHHGHH